MTKARDVRCVEATTRPIRPVAISSGRSAADIRLPSSIEDHAKVCPVTSWEVSSSSFYYYNSSTDVCIASRTYALQQRASSPYTVKYVPRCREDGTYAPVQCIDGGGCWCVNGQGKQLPNTMVQHGKPICVKKGKSNQRRSSPRNPIRNKRSKS